MRPDFGVTQNDQHAMGETRVWQAVLLQTIQEWLHGPMRRSMQAERYLFFDNIDFPMVCQSAGMDPGRLRAGLERIRNRSTKPEELAIEPEEVAEAA